MNKFLLSIVAVTGFMLGESTISQPTWAARINLVKNPSFERGPAIGGPDSLCPDNPFFVCVRPGIDVFPHWEVFTLKETPYIPIDYIPRKLWRTKSGAGQWSLDLSGSDKGGIRQTIQTEVGQSYELRFLLAGNPVAGPNPKELLFSSIAGEITPFTFDASRNTLTQMRWETKRLIFKATSTQTTITFLSNTSGNYGPALDEISVRKTRGRVSNNNRTQSLTRASSQRASVSVPENSSAFGIAAFGFLGAGLMLKNKMRRSGDI